MLNKAIYIISEKEANIVMKTCSENLIPNGTIVRVRRKTSFVTSE